MVWTGTQNATRVVRSQDATDLMRPIRTNQVGRVAHDIGAGDGPVNVRDHYVVVVLPQVNHATRQISAFA